jgi:hypothetical protein
MRAAVLASQRPEAVDLDALRDKEGAGLLGSLVNQRARFAAARKACPIPHDIRGCVGVENAITGNLALSAKL